MIDWIPISSPPKIIEVDDIPLHIAGKPLPAVRRSGPVLIALEHPFSKQRQILVGRVCFAEGYPDPFERVYGRRIVAWAPIDWPSNLPAPEWTT